MRLLPERPDWFRLVDPAEISSPALLVYPARVAENIKRMMTLAGQPERLRPHIKTHKMREVLQIQLQNGLTKVKCATIAEAELAAQEGVADVLIAYQPVGPNVPRLAQLRQRFPQTRFSVLVDDPKVLETLSASSLSPARHGGFSAKLEVLVDLDVGQHRTGIASGPEAAALYRSIADSRGLSPGGLHAYDGHLNDADPFTRAQVCELAFAPVLNLRQELQQAGLPVPRVVAGGTPTFPVHARRPDVECSPGTCVFWDASYAARLRDLDFLHAAVMLTRIVSKPGPERLCLDLGHKAIAAEMPHPRVKFLNLDDARALAQSEEHLVIETGRSAEFEPGDCLYGVPWHICPTVALHSEAVVVENGRAVGSWKVAARDRRLTI